MKRTIGGILSAAGLLGILYFGYQYLQDTESFDVLGTNVTVSSGDYVPIIISAVVLVVGILIGWKK